MTNWIRKNRDRLLLTQAELAEQVGVATNTVARWESGDRQPDRRNLRRLSEVFGLPLKQVVEMWLDVTTK